MWLLDSTNADTHFKEGLLLLKEYRFDDAIAAFDRALTREPLMREALVHRGLARLKKYKYEGVHTRAKDFLDSPILFEDLVAVPAEEQEKICADFRKAGSMDFSELFVARLVPGMILRYCRNQDPTKRD